MNRQTVFNSGESIRSSVPLTSPRLPLVQLTTLISCPLPSTWCLRISSLSKSCQLPSLLSMFLWDHTSTYCTFGKTYLICFSLSEKWDIEFFSPVNLLLERVPWKWQLTISYNFTKSLPLQNLLAWVNSSRILFKVILRK